MIKAVVSGEGRHVMIIGLSFDNLRKFMAEPGDTYIRIDGAEMGIPFDVTIFSGKTEQACINTIQEFIGPDTRITDTRDRQT